MSDPLRGQNVHNATTSNYGIVSDLIVNSPLPNVVVSYSSKSDLDSHIESLQHCLKSVTEHELHEIGALNSTLAKVLRSLKKQSKNGL